MNTFFIMLSLTVACCYAAGYGAHYSHPSAIGSTGAVGDQYHHRSGDGSYDFGYNTATGGFQSERRTPGGQVTGKYGHTNPDGTFVNVEYQGQSTGGAGGFGGSSYSRYSAEKAAGAAYAAPAVSAPLAATSPFYVPPAAHRSSYVASQRSSYVAPQRYTAPGRPQEYAQFNLERKPDGSYQYSYQSSDSSKTESRSGDGQVQGSFSFRGDDGVQRSVGYTAGQQGFLASGAHLPVTPDGEPAAGTNQGAAGGVYSVSGAGASGAALQSQRYSTGYKSQQFNYQQPSTAPIQLIKPQAYSSGASRYSSGAYSSGAYTEPVDESPKPFAFNYNAGDHSRTEQADGSGVVRGTYTVNTPDGTFKQLTYQADDTGFHVLDEKQVESGGGSSGGSGAAAAALSTYGTGHAAAAYTAGQTYKPKSIHSPSYYR